MRNALTAGRDQIVSLNRGEVDGVERGHVLAVWRAGVRTIDRTDGARTPMKLPDERHGLMFVFRVFRRMSYGLILTVTMSLLLVATAVLMRRTVPMIMVWSALFVLCRVIADFLATQQMLDPAWRLIDLWNDLYVCGMFLLGSDIDAKRYGAQPAAWQAFAVVGGVCAASAAFLRNRVKAVEVVR